MNFDDFRNQFERLLGRLKEYSIIDTGTTVLETVYPETTFFIEPFRMLCSASDKFRFNYMLKGLGEGLDMERKMNELYNYVRNEDRAFYVTDCFRKTLLSKAPIACCIMGIILSDITNGDFDLGQTDVLIMNALMDFTDYDIRNFYEITGGNFTSVTKEGTQFIDESKFPEEKRRGYDLTIGLCCQTRVMKKGPVLQDDGGLVMDAIQFDDVSEKLRAYIDRAHRQLSYGLN